MVYGELVILSFSVVIDNKKILGRYQTVCPEGLSMVKFENNTAHTPMFKYGFRAKKHSHVDICLLIKLLD